MFLSAVAYQDAPTYVATSISTLFGAVVSAAGADPLGHLKDAGQAIVLDPVPS
jgi:hypothetical protein